MRLVIVSNRLPVTFQRHTPAEPFKRSIGGLVTGIGSYIKRIQAGQTPFSGYLWVGWPGSYIREEDQASLSSLCRKEYNFVPVFFSEQLSLDHYSGFCNKVLWPLFHCCTDHVRMRPETWHAYRQANELFFSVLDGLLRSEDVIWVQDYHLMLLPDLIRRSRPAAKISFFLHIPFPAFDLFRHLSKTEQSGLLTGLLGADLVGFHTEGYAADFLQCVSRVLKMTPDEDRLTTEGRQVKTGVFPMGIDYTVIRDLSRSESCIRSRGDITRLFPAYKIILSVDRLDYTKGIVNRLKAFYRLLQEYPEWKEKVIFMLLVAPSRREIKSYREIKKSIDKWVGKINGIFGTHLWVPVIYQYRQLDLEELCALYTASDLALVTPLKDGMNLIAKEYLAARTDGLGVLILSETAGAVHELTGALAVNPYSIEEIAEAMHEGLQMTAEEQYTRNQPMHQRLRLYDVVRWAQDIMEITLHEALPAAAGKGALPGAATYYEDHTKFLDTADAERQEDGCRKQV